MILYDAKQKHSLLEFGIEIPISNSKAVKSIKFLIEHPVFKTDINKYLKDKVDEKIIKEDLLRVHSNEYVEKLFSDKLEVEIIRTYELIDKDGRYHRYNPRNAALPFSLLLENVLSKVAGTYECCKLALNNKFCFYFGGGMHHAKKDYGEGFCLVNDIVIAIRKLQAEKLIKTAWIIDVDAHKGDGTAALTEDDDSIITLSIHMAKGWPLDGEMYINGKLNPSFIPGNIEIPVEENDAQNYNRKLEGGLNTLSSYPLPEIALVVLGSDPFELDELPSAQLLKLSLEQMMNRDLLIYNFLKKQGIKQAYIMAGGYGEESWRVYTQFLEYVLTDLYY